MKNTATLRSLTSKALVLTLAATVALSASADFITGLDLVGA